MGFESPVAEKCPIITDDSARGTKMRENIFFQKFDNHPIVIRPGRYGLYPFWDIVHRNQDVLVAEWTWKWSHKINAPNIKNFNLQNRV